MPTESARVFVIKGRSQHPQPENDVSLDEGHLPRAQPRRTLFNKLKQFRHIAIRYDKLGANFFAFVKLACVRIWLRSIEPTV